MAGPPTGQSRQSLSITCGGCRHLEPLSGYHWGRCGSPQARRRRGFRRRVDTTEDTCSYYEQSHARKPTTVHNTTKKRPWFLFAMRILITGFLGRAKGRRSETD